MTGKQQNQLTKCDETKQRALNTQTVSAKNQLIHDGPSLIKTVIKISGYNLAFSTKKKMNGVLETLILIAFADVFCLSCLLFYHKQ